MHNKFSFGICFVSFNYFTGAPSAHMFGLNRSMAVNCFSFLRTAYKRTSEWAQRETNPSIIAEIEMVFGFEYENVKIIIIFFAFICYIIFAWV